MHSLYRPAALDLCAEPLENGRSLRLRVNGNSMSPALRPGDLLVIRAVSPEALRPGDLLVVRRPSDLVTHRLIAWDRDGYHTKGDAYPQPDLPVPAGEVLGRVAVVKRGGRYIDYALSPWPAVNSILGLLGRWEAAAWGLGWVSARERRPRSGRLTGRLLSFPFSLAGRCLSWSAAHANPGAFRHGMRSGEK